jgi:hypothetical protein
LASTSRSTKLDHGHRRIVAIAEAGLEDAGVTAVAVLVALAKRVEQLATSATSRICEIA